MTGSSGSVDDRQHPFTLEILQPLHQCLLARCGARCPPNIDHLRQVDGFSDDET